ncbi:MAG: hypothetical protein HYX89_03995, partial [Chloroflexi bacterium]|nr:hypothetical protein [Chloroflexota bacterium]
MNGNLLDRSLRFNMVSMASYAFGLFLYALFIAALYPSVKSVDYSQIIEQMPEAFLKAFGVESSSFFAPGGLRFADYVGFEYAFYLPIIAGFFAVFAAGGAIAREMDHGTLDPLLA